MCIVISEKTVEVGFSKCDFHVGKASVSTFTLECILHMKKISAVVRNVGVKHIHINCVYVHVVIVVTGCVKIFIK